MKATFDKQKLLAALIPAAGISQTKNTLTAVDGLLFECPPDPKYGDYDTDRDDLCRISAFDLEKGLRSSVECKVYEKGMFVINTVKVLQIVRALPDGEVTIEIDDKGHAKISGGFSQFEISANPGDNFPTMPRCIGERIYQIPQVKIRDLIAETVFSVAQNDQRAAFNGALLKIKGGEMTMVASDGSRLSASKCKLDGEDLPEAEIVIPGKYLNELTKMLRDTEDELTMIIGRKHIIFKIDNIYFFTRMLDTEYINYEKLIPVTYMTEVFVSRDEILGALERASIVTEDKLGGSGRSHVKLEVADGYITMSSVSSGGSVYERVPAAIDGADVTIGFNCKYLLEAFRACPSECDRLRIRLNSPLMMITIEPSGGTNYVDASPNEDVFGARALDVKRDVEIDEKMNMFMYLIAPVRMNK